jgi:hypothetical protein
LVSIAFYRFLWGTDGLLSVTVGFAEAAAGERKDAEDRDPGLRIENFSNSDVGSRGVAESTVGSGGHGQVDTLVYEVAVYEAVLEVRGGRVGGRWHGQVSRRRGCACFEKTCTD